MVVVVKEVSEFLSGGIEISKLFPLVEFFFAGAVESFHLAVLGRFSLVDQIMADMQPLAFQIQRMILGLNGSALFKYPVYLLVKVAWLSV